MEISALCDRIARAPRIFPMGRIVELRGGITRIQGFGNAARIGARVALGNTGQVGEIVALDSDGASVLPEGGISGLALGQRVIITNDHHVIQPSVAWLGRVVDADGRSMDGLPLPTGAVSVPVRSAPPPAVSRDRLGPRVDTGYAVFNTFLPLVKGQRIGLFSGSGVGKSRLLAGLAQRVEADITVIAMIGERGRELRQFTEDTLGAEGMKSAVVVAATSDDAPSRRYRAALTAMAVAEFFRDQGKHVLFLMDSVTRFAEAFREVQSGLGAGTQARGFPAATAHEIMALCERAGPGAKGSGAITGIFSVLVAGSDMEEPVADILRGVLDGHVILDREIAERGRFPAIDLLRSVSRALPEAASEDENALLIGARSLLGRFERSRIMVEAGLYTSGSDPELDQAIDIWPELDAFISKDEISGIKNSFDRLRLIMRRVRKG